MNIRQTRFLKGAVLATALQFTLVGQSTNTTPDTLRVPGANELFLKTSATGTQNYVCVPGQADPAWKFLGPQATLSVKIWWFQKEIDQQVATHFLSMNPSENGLARATWQHSMDSSAVWAKAIATSTDPAWVAPGAIPWLLLQVTGVKRGPAGGGTLADTTYIQRLNTAGGIAPTTGCDASTLGAIALVPYSTDYLFYRAKQ